jgi:hypothetical protein
MTPRFYIGQLDKITFTMTETENAAGPLSNLKTYFADYVWLSSTIAANQRLILDFGEDKYCDFCIVENHNFAAIGADSVQLQCADDAAFTVNVVTVSSGLATLGSPGKIEFTGQTKRYWSILFAKASGLLAAIPQIGQVFVNNKFEVLNGYNHGYRAGNTEYQTAVKRNLNGIELGYQAHGGRLVFEFRFSKQNEDFKTNWISLQNSARGRLNPFYYCDPSDGAWYVRLTEDYDPVRTLAKNNQETEMIKLRTVGDVSATPHGWGEDFGGDFGGGF